MEISKNGIITSPNFDEYKLYDVTISQPTFKYTPGGGGN